MALSIDKRIETLPPLPESAVEIEKLRRQDDYDMKELLKIISKDPMIIANILKVANSAMYWFAGKINDTKKAVVMLWFELITNIAISTIIRNLIKPNLDPYGIDTETFSLISWAQSRLIEQRQEPKIKNLKKDLQLAAFLQEVWKIVIAMILNEHGLAKEFKKQLSESWNISEVENAVLNATSASIAAKVFAHWNFHIDMVKLIEYSDEPGKAPVELMCWSYALKIVKILCPVSENRFTKESIRQSILLAWECDLDIDALEKVIDRVSSAVGCVIK